MESKNLTFSFTRKMDEVENSHQLSAVQLEIIIYFHLGAVLEVLVGECSYSIPLTKIQAHLYSRKVSF